MTLEDDLNSNSEEMDKIVEEVKNMMDLRYFDLIDSYTRASNENLYNEERKIDYFRLNDEDIQDKMVDSMMPILKEAYKSQTGIDLDKIKIEILKGRLFEEYYGFDEQKLRYFFREYKDKVTLRAFANDIVQKNIDILYKRELEYLSRGFDKK